MNYYFGINNGIFRSQIQIPLFQNRNLNINNLKLYKTYPKDNNWLFTEITNKKINDYFFILRNDEISNNDIFFLAEEKALDKFDKKELKNLDNHTDTKPAYRANLQIYLENGGFSSYQSEYPFSMINKKGTILSSISSLANPEADKNFILIKNIYKEPKDEKFKAYLVNYKLKNIEDQFEIRTNYTNCIEINKKLIRPEIFLITDRYLGIPMYVSVKNNFISFEHTHPPHEYILSENKFIKVSNLKKEINEIIG